MEITQTKQKKNKKDSLRDLLDIITDANMCIIKDCRRRKEKEAGRDLFEEIMAKYFLNLWKKMDIEGQEA